MTTPKGQRITFYGGPKDGESLVVADYLDIITVPIEQPLTLREFDGDPTPSIVEKVQYRASRTTGVFTCDGYQEPPLTLQELIAWAEWWQRQD